MASACILGLLVAIVSVSISVSIFSAMFLLLARIRGCRKESGPTIFCPCLIKKAKYLSFLEKDGIMNLEWIKRGGSRVIYKAELRGSNGKMISIKQIIPPQNKEVYMRQSRSEINILGQIPHWNILPLLAHVSVPNCHYLVFELMRNGSLGDVLKKVQQGERELDWPTRHRIVLRIALGLEYIHMSHSPRILHRDLKRDNILLNNDMEARIADFRVANAMSDDHTHVTCTHPVGKLGYFAPEYHQIYQFTDKCDIFSFGVMLEVLVTGKSLWDDFFRNHVTTLIYWMRNAIASENPIQAIDPKLLGTGYDQQMLQVLKIDCLCCVEHPEK